MHVVVAGIVIKVDAPGIPEELVIDTPAVLPAMELITSEVLALEISSDSTD